MKCLRSAKTLSLKALRFMKFTPKTFWTSCTGKRDERMDGNEGGNARRGRENQRTSGLEICKNGPVKEVLECA